MATNSESHLSQITTPLFGEGAKIIAIFHQLYAADERIGDLLKTIRHITLNVENVRGLRRLNASHLSTHNLAWIDALISDAADALGGLATLVERARVDKETRESISWWNRGRWVAYFAPKVKEKYLKLTMCHQSLLSVFPFLFSNPSGLAPVHEETKGDDQQPCDPTMVKWLGWQDQRQRRRSDMNLRTPTLPQRPMSTSSSLTDMTIASAVSSNSSASTESTASEISSPEVRISCYPAESSQSNSPASVNVNLQSYEVSPSSYSEKHSSGSRDSLRSCLGPDLVADLTYPVFHTKFEDNYDSLSALPEDATGGRNDNVAPSTKPWDMCDGADGLQVYVPLDGSETLRDLIHQLQVSPFESQDVTASRTTAIEQRSEGFFEPAGAFRPGRAPALPQEINGAGNPADTEHKMTPGPSLPFSNIFAPFDFERPISLTPLTVIGESSELRSLDNSEDGAGPSPGDKKPPVGRAHSDTYTSEYPLQSRPGLSQSGRVHAATGGGTSPSSGQRGARRGSRSWLAFHSSRPDLRQGDGWGEG
ncbi:hypothetical protein BDR22DRAFT_973332 [Usnea florida]